MGRGAALRAGLAALAALAWAQSARAQAPAPPAPRVLLAPTALLQPDRGVHATLGADHRGDTFLAVTVGLGGLAEAEVGWADLLVPCGRWCPERERGLPAVAPALAVALRLGIAERRWAAWQPGLALGFHRSFAPDSDLLSFFHPVPRTSQLHLVASRSWPQLVVHAGAAMWDAVAVAAGPSDRPAALHSGPLSGALRPLLGLEWKPPIYPKTRVLADVAWLPSIVSGAAPQLRWRAAVGVRYQAFRRASIELSVRLGEPEPGRGGVLEESTVFARFNAAWAPDGAEP